MRTAGIHRQRGVALITAILVVSISVIAATAVLDAGNDAIQRGATFQDSERAWWYAVGCEDYVKSLLDRDETKNVDGLEDDWNQVNGTLPVAQGEGDGALSGRLIDLQGRFNLNNLGAVNEDYRNFYAAQFERLLAGIEGIDTFVAPELAQAIRDWIDEDQEPSGFGGAEDNEYLGRDPPYRTPNRPMQSLTELLAVKGMTREIYVRLRDYVTVLPSSPTTINLNTASEIVVRSFTAQPSDELETFLRERREQPATDLGALNPLFTAEEIPQSLKVLAVGTRFFALECDATISNGRVALYSQLYRPSGGDTKVLARSTDSE